MKTRLLFFFIVFALAIGSETAFAASYTWTGTGGNTNWDNNSNWSPSSGHPVAGDDVNIPSTTVKPTVNVTSACKTITMSGTTTLTLSAALTVSSTLTVGGNSYVCTIAGTNAATFGGLTDVGYQSQLVISSGATVTFASGSTVNNSSSQKNITNSGTMVFLSSCTFNFGYGTSFVNNGIVRATSTVFNLNNSPCFLSNTSVFNATSCTFTVSGTNAYIQSSGSGAIFTSQGCTFTFSGSGGASYMINAGVFRDHASSFSLTGQGNYIQNTGGAANMHLSGTNITMGTTANGNNSRVLNNSNILTADSTSIFLLTQQTDQITNTGIFNAGVSGSPCIITLSGQGASITNGNASTNTGGTFNLGATSIITASGYGSSVTNSVTTKPSIFTLESDATGSATAGSLNTSGSGNSAWVGKFNIQRFLSGGPSSSYRSYRLLSSPTNITSASASTAASPNYISLNYLNTAASVLYPNATGSTTTATNYYGAYLGGPSPGTGFNYSPSSNSNPTVYFYNEPSISGNSTFYAGKNVGVTSIGTNVVSLKSTQAGTLPNKSIPVGNGYILFYIGSTYLGISNPSPSVAPSPDNATITYQGYINQQSVPVVLWYAPTGGSAGNLSFTSSIVTTPPSTVQNYPGINMVGNPYPSVIDLQQVVNDNPSGPTTFYELQDIPTQTYVSYKYSGGAVTTSSSNASRYISSGQGFLVQATSIGQSLTFREDQKVYGVTYGTYSGSPSLSPAPIALSLAKNQTAVSGSVKGGAASAKSFALVENPSGSLAGLHLKMNLDSVIYHECGIYFNNNWSDKYNLDDALDLDGISPKVYLSSFTTDGYRVGINSLGSYVKGKRIKLFVNASANGAYSMQLEDIKNIDTALFNIYLVDHFKKDSVNIVNTKLYTFNITKTDTTTFGSNRFELAVDRKPLPSYQLISFTGQKVTKGVSLTWKTSNEGTYTGFAIEKQDANGAKYSTLYSAQSTGAGTYTYTDRNPVSGNNTYRLLQNDIDSNTTYSNPINVLYNTAATSTLLSVYPNPAKESITISFNDATNVLTTNVAAQTYQANIFSSTGALITQKTVTSNSWSENVSALKPGAYIIEIRSGNGSVIGNTKFTKFQ